MPKLEDLEDVEVESCVNIGEQRMNHRDKPKAELQRLKSSSDTQSIALILCSLQLQSKVPKRGEEKNKNISFGQSLTVRFLRHYVENRLGAILVDPYPAKCMNNLN